MAIVQVSQITNRLGLPADLPQLAGGELGWSTDSRQLYIGNGTLTEGAPVIGNTEILTEFSDILNLGSVYTYQGTAAGYTVQTGPTPGAPVVQSLQNWMDQWASVKDFGAKGDGVTDDTAAINRALNQLYCQPAQQSIAIRRSLYFPAGVYIVSSPINIPTYATLYGEGPDNSIIRMAATGGTGSYVAQTADSLQQTGINIGNGGAIPPKNITIANIAFSSFDSTKNIFLVQSATHCEFKSVSFFGNGTTSTLTTSALNTTCVDFGSTASLVTMDILFDGCRFRGSVYGVSTSQQTKGLTFVNSNFNILYQGIALGTTGTIVNGGPTGTRITNNIFDNIYAQGISISTRLNASGYNIFYDVANSFNGVISPSDPIILFSEQENVSIGDMFQRSAAYAVLYPQVSHTVNNIVTSNGDQISLGTLTVQSGLQAILQDATPIATTIFTLDTTVSPAFSIEYSITRFDGYRYGTFDVSSVAPLVFGNQVSYSDDFNENIDLGVTLTAFQDPNNPRYISIQYTTGAPLTGHGAVMNYSIRHF